LRLKELGYNAELLPLFGNIPIDERKNDVIPCNNKYTFVIFGTIHARKPFAPFIKQIKEIALKYHFTFSLNFIGRNGDELKNWIGILSEENMEYKVYGEKTIFEISRLLSEADIGITSNPPIYAEKSGTVAAMIEHGLKTICISEPPHIKKRLEDVYNPLKLFLFDQGAIDLALFSKKNEKKMIKNKLNLVASILIKNLV
jgi:hypothetical protein